MEREPNRSAGGEGRPSFAILVEGGVVQTVVSAGEHVVYRLIDLDGAGPEEWMIADSQTDQEHVNIELFTRDAAFPYIQPAPDAHLEQEYEDRVSGLEDS
jgi:hypothetical protein